MFIYGKEKKRRQEIDCQYYNILNKRLKNKYYILTFFIKNELIS